jgi:hypothetical protein
VKASREGGDGGAGEAQADLLSSIRPDWRLAKLLIESLRTRNRRTCCWGPMAKVLGDEGIELI